ncbi:hypothetical protein U9M48_002912 [Paspalum notatum var. saurae]|uniref:Uncharacterized protein n=1 Tax=Paspalum notatum var. saurae TaxID=547442 RepID=A0AAQ3PRY3_PASNO
MARSADHITKSADQGPPDLPSQPIATSLIHIMKKTQVHSNPTARPSIQCIQRPKMHQVMDPQRHQSKGEAKWPM